MDILIMRVPAGVRHFSELPRSFEHDLAPLVDVRRLLKATFPGIRFGQEGWAALTAGGSSIEINFGRRDPCQSIMLHIDEREAGLPVIRALCEAGGWAALDLLEGDFIYVAASNVPRQPEGVGLRLVVPLSDPAKPQARKAWWRFWK